jgi:hypothetical protein
MNEKLNTTNKGAFFALRAKNRCSCKKGTRSVFSGKIATT